MTTRVVLDAGLYEGEAAHGALAALDADGELAVTLVGPAEPATPGADHDRLTVVEAAGRVTRDDDPAVAVRARRDASIRVAIERLEAGEADALVSPGPLGATVTAAQFVLGRAPGGRWGRWRARQPALGAWLDHPAGTTVLADAGAGHALPAAALVRLAELAGPMVDDPGPTVGLLAPTGLADGCLREADRLLAGALEDRYRGPVTLAAALDRPVSVLVGDGQLGALALDALRASGGDVRVRPAGLLLGVGATVAVLVGEPDRDAIATALATAARMARRYEGEVASAPGSGTDRSEGEVVSASGSDAARHASAPS